MPPRLQQAVFGQGAGRDQPHHVALHHRFRAALLRLGRILHLLGDRHAEPLADQRQQVALGRMHRHAAHLDRLAAMGAALGQGDIQRLGRQHGILEEHLVEIAHPVEQAARRDIAPGYPGIAPSSASRCRLPPSRRTPRDHRQTLAKPLGKGKPARTGAPRLCAPTLAEELLLNPSWGHAIAAPRRVNLLWCPNTPVKAVALKAAAHPGIARWIEKRTTVESGRGR